MERCWWTDLVHADEPIDLAHAEQYRHGVHPEFRPDVVFLLNPQVDPLAGARYTALAGLFPAETVVLTGHDGEVGEEMFVTLFERGLYWTKPPIGGASR